MLPNYKVMEMAVQLRVSKKLSNYLVCPTAWGGREKTPLIALLNFFLRDNLGLNKLAEAIADQGIP